jgi:hypothetical protein
VGATGLRKGHPLGFTQGQCLSEHYLNSIIGNPIESTIALNHLIFEDVLDCYPGLEFCVAHGGGNLSGYWGRSAPAKVAASISPARHRVTCAKFGSILWCSTVHS